MSLDMLDYICLFIQQYGESPNSSELGLWYKKMVPNSKTKTPSTATGKYKLYLKLKGYITVTDKSMRNIVVLDRRYIDKYKLYQESEK